MESDRKKKSYNPFLLLFDHAELDTEKKLDIKAALMNTIAKASAAIDLMPFEGRRDLYGVINNILSEGLPRMADAVLLDEKEPTNQNSNTENTLETENKDERPLEDTRRLARCERRGDKKRIPRTCKKIPPR
jgi:hypothetical protein